MEIENKEIFNPIERTLYLNGEITDELVMELIEKINKINDYENVRYKEHFDILEDNMQFIKVKEGDEVEFLPPQYDVEPIRIIINSNGGECEAGMALINSMKTSNVPIITEVIGKAYSMAFIIALMGHMRLAYKTSSFMFHNVSYGIFDDLESHNRQLEQAKNINDIIKEIVINRTKIKPKKIKKIFKERRDWFMRGDEALKLEIVDELIDDNMDFRIQEDENDV